ncbi:MAG: ABC transporter ATP-binding protein [Gemmatimonadales bacterium]
MTPASRSTSRRLLGLLSWQQRLTAARLLGLMLLGMILETLGVGLIIPTLSLMTQPDALRRYAILRPWLEGPSAPTPARLIVGGMLLLVAVYVVKALFLAILAWRQARFISVLHVDLSQRLFAGYLAQPYTFHLQRNSAQLVNTVAQVREITGAVQSCLVLIAEALVMAGLSVLLFWVEPVGALVVGGALGGVAWAFNRATSKRLLRAGVERQRHEALRIQSLHHGLGGVKELKVLGREPELLARYRVHNEASSRAGEWQVGLSSMPRISLELFAVAGLATLVIVMLWHGRSPAALLPVVGIFAAAAFRAMPSIGRIMSALQALRYFSPAIELIDDEFRLLVTAPPANGVPLEREGAIILDCVAYRYPAAAAATLHDVSATIPRGATVGIIGESGAGKSTLIDLIIGLLTPSSGTISVGGSDIQQGLANWQRRIGYVPQSIFLSDESLRMNVAFGIPLERIDEAALWRAVHAAQLTDLVGGLPDGLNTVVGERGVRLSGGQRQRIGIARALYHDPPVLVLDEATSSLDEATEGEVLEAISLLRGSRTVLIVSHRASTLRDCDVGYRLENGRLLPLAAKEWTLPAPARLVDERIGNA